MTQRFAYVLFGAALISFCLQTAAQNAAETTKGDLQVVRHFVAPDYPVAAWLARIQGTVVTEVALNPDGKVHSVKFVSAHPIFRKSVETALAQWSFEVSAATTVKITTQFKLDGECPLTGSEEPDKRYYVQTQVAADLPATVEVKTCLPIMTIETNQTRRH